MATVLRERGTVGRGERFGGGEEVTRRTSVRRLRRLLLTTLLAASFFIAMSGPANAYRCDGPDDPVCIAIAKACLLAGKAGLGTTWCELG